MATGSNIDDSEEEISSDCLFKTRASSYNSSTVLFKRGIKVLGKNWMGRLNRQFKLRDLYLLGSHDSGAISGKMKYQSGSILQQLFWGVRFLDIQVGEYENAIWLFYGEPCVLLKEVLIEIDQFVNSQPAERVIISLRQSLTCNTLVDWATVKQCFEDNLTAVLVSKDQVDVNINEMNGNVILMGPGELHMERNVGLELLLKHATTENNLNEFLMGLTKGNFLKEKGDKIVWVECRSRSEISKRVSEEILTVQDSSFFSAKERLHFNVVSFSFVDNTHFSLIKEYFRIWANNQ
ncbi:Phosphatidylinositol diacylglycerol-lyase [Oopsacas minuta]|uniref:Phosphatidylinositol diacylglycerol-lyase n=1 Tax=Oopsacas minuta TaxID=111878 RepID=A0AAV7JZ92_9METZ|nr:Phosphatidylinositol diacylglycerol-lyase [Oopsacas minuta]